MKYRVLTIEEDLEFGCEERSENQPVMAVVTLEDETGVIQKKKFPDQELYDQEISEKDMVVVTRKGRIIRCQDI